MKGILGKLEFALEREVLIRAPRKLVFRYFTDSERFARWWGAGSTIAGRAGGPFKIVYPDGSSASGEVLELAQDERIVLSYGYDAPGKPIAPGASRVIVTLADHPQGTLLHLRHEVADAPTRDAHVAGWRYQLSVFANVASDEAHANAARLADGWFAAWNEPDASARRKALAELVSADVTLQDAYSCLRGLDDLDGHVAATKIHMPGLTIERSGDPRHCQGSALVDWIVKGPNGQAFGRGINLFELTPDGRIARVVGFWTKT